MKAKSRPRPLWPCMLFIAVLWVLLGFASSARAETACTGFTDALAQLRATYSEVILWQGVAESGQRLIITANPDGTTWTALIPSATVAGQLCFVAAGATWSVGEDVPAPAGREG